MPLTRLPPPHCIPQQQAPVSHPLAYLIKLELAGGIFEFVEIKAVLLFSCVFVFLVEIQELGVRFEKSFFFVFFFFVLPFELIGDTQNSLVEGIVSLTAIFLKVLHDCISSSPFLVVAKIEIFIIA
ncbi:hypothetical protein VNO78_25114 [Psophocarpus tetragonolobus]|uniref:Uncharacterized protein n=1 Tax=Psophocarpus tetragonolobus TaxID=3891 RepID=A0AAN9XF01_PSOTE